MEKIKTYFESVINEDVISKAYLDGKLLKITGHISLLVKCYNEFKLQYNKYSVEEVLVQRAVKMPKQFMIRVYLIIMLKLIKF